ncbi:protein Rf1, mitochondrial-like [Solanum verrucosum]|nr:protein Rf1, mitochondrial-like [Solanum verrucosum]
MVKLVQQSWWKFRTCFLRVSSSYSTETETLASLFLANKDEQCLNPLTSSPKNALYSRLLYLARSKESVISVLDKWVTEQNPIKYEDLQIIVRQFRAYRRYNHALQIFEWIKKSKDFDISPRDFAVELDLVSKAHGLEAAETYFTSIPDDLRTYQVYGALLNCYADAKVLKKAEDTMQKLKELAYAGTVAYNVMMTLYAKLGYLEKLQSLMLEMEDKGIPGDVISYNILLNAYASVPNVTEMEKVLMKMEADPLLINWSPYTVVAKGYLKAGDIEKANESLKKCENRLKGKREKLGIDMLITLYTSMGNKDDVYRIWNKYNKKVKHHNSSYHCMIRGLEKLDDLDGAEKIFAEWETNRVHFDIRIPNLLISAYCKKGHMEKAISIIEQLEESGKHPNGSTWNRLALGYCVQNDMDKAVDTMKKAILASKPGWKPHFHSLASCVKYLQSKGDTQGEEELKDLLRVRGLCSKEFERGLDKYIEIGNRKSEALDETDIEEICVSIAASKRMISGSVVLFRYLANFHVLQIFLNQLNVDLTKAIPKFAHIMKFIFEWIKRSKDFYISPRDFAVELDLVSKAHGLEAAETYFTSIPDDLRTYQVYGALLNCYADAKVLKKAEDTMQKLKELAYAGTVAYNVMMTLYAKLGYLEKLQSLMLEMEDKGIPGDVISYNILLNAYASVPDVTEMEKVLMKMEADPLLINWSPYTVVAKGYLKAGDIEKANESLKKCENRLKGKREKLGIDMLITLYTSMGKKDVSIIFAEWETNRVHFDIRIPNLLISAYCKKGHMEKAISIIEQLEESGKHPNGSTWNRLALGYCVQNYMEKAVETMEKAILASKPGWKPHFHSLASCVKYLQSKGDTQGEEELKDLLRVRGLCSKEFERGLDKYIEIGNRKSEALNETDLEDTC